MPFNKKRYSRKRSGLSKSQTKAVKAICKNEIDDEIEDKQFVTTYENVQLYHNKSGYAYKFLEALTYGTNDGDQSTGATGLKTVRIGDQITLKNINIRLWLSNKDDRPNCMYKGILFWYPIGSIPGDAMVYKTQTNKMLDRYNNKDITIIDTFIVQSKASYSSSTGYAEHSYLATLNKSYKGMKIKYDGLSGSPKMRDIGFAVVAYDAWGTVQTDNIASFAWQSQMTFQDA